MAIQSVILATTTFNSSDAHPKRRSQFRSSIASAPSLPAAQESFDATHITSSSVKSRGTMSVTSPYVLKAAHVGFLTGGTRIYGCFSQRTSATGPRFLCIGHPGGDTLPPPCWLPDRRHTEAYHTIPCHGNLRPQRRPSHLRRRRPCPSGRPLPPRRPPPDPSRPACYARSEEVV